MGMEWVDQLKLPEKYARSETVVAVLNLGVHHFLWRHSVRRPHTQLLSLLS